MKLTDRAVDAFRARADVSRAFTENATTATQRRQEMKYGFKLARLGAKLEARHERERRRLPGQYRPLSS